MATSSKGDSEPWAVTVGAWLKHGTRDVRGPWRLPSVGSVLAWMLSARCTFTFEIIIHIHNSADFFGSASVLELGK